MKTIGIGDLVIFVSSWKAVQNDYNRKGPGVVTKLTQTGNARVRWSSGEWTVEHLSYLQVANKHSHMVRK